MLLSADDMQVLVAFAAEKTAESLLCLNTEGKILYVNPAAARTLGEPAPELCRRDIFSVAPDMNPALWKELWKEIRANSSFAFEFQLGSADHRIQVEMTVYHLEHVQTELACVFFRDIEERKRLQTLQQEFVSTASHELRTPMTVIREGISQVAEGLRGDVNDSQKRALTLALNGIDRLARIIDELLDISKIESGKIVLKRERLDVAALAREVGGTFQNLAHDRGLDLRVTTPAGPVILYGDRDRLIQVFTNLISNSFKFTEKGSIQITVSSREGEVECSVSDTGIGLTPEDAEKIFNKFEQLGRISFTGEKGTGLGLSITRGIVELHKGRVWAESTGPGKGLRLAFTLPRQSGQDVFVDQLTGMLREAARRGGNLSTVVFRAESPKGDAQVQSSLPTALTSLENLVRRQSGRVTDLVVLDESAVYLALQSTVKREAVRVAERVEEAFEEYLSRQKPKGKLRMTYTVTGFPEEAKDEEAYLSKIFRPEAA